jgi:hypothetical protein
MSAVKKLKRIKLEDFTAKARCAEEVEVLIQKLGDRWYAFWELNGKIYCQLPEKKG